VEFAGHDLPFMAIAATFQTDPSVLIAHPGTEMRWEAYDDRMAAVGVYPEGIDIGRGYTLRFVDHRVGMRGKS